VTRRFLRGGLFLTLVLLAGCGRGGDKAAGPAPPLKIEQVRVGLPNSSRGAETGRSRNGAWAPVYVKLKPGKDGVPAGAYRLVVQTSDAEDAAARYTVAVPGLDPDAEKTIFAYCRPGNTASDVSVILQTADGQAVQTVEKVTRTAPEVLAANAQFYLAVGATLPGLNRALNPPKDKDNADDGEDTPARSFAVIEKVELLPDRWFGYDAVDLVVLCTSRREFVNALAQDKDRRDALHDWVRRGGKLVLSVGRNHQEVQGLLSAMRLLDCEIKGAVPRPRALLRNVAAYAGSGEALRKVDLADVVAGPSAHVLVREPAAADDNTERPVIVQGSCGLGRVVLVAFDVDTPPFTGWAGERAFWDRLVKDMVPQPQETGKVELANTLQQGLESFDEVTPVSFGWVALFILFYILLVGPIDYFVLKKIFKRLELTWLTFPTVVVVVSVTAYLIAYSLKGEDLRVNKIDLVEIDLHDNRAYGTTCFALFSPRIENFTLGVEPSWPQGDVPGWFPPPGKDGTVKVHSWASGKDGKATYPAVLAALTPPGRPSMRTGTPGLFTQPYDHAADGAGLERVPIPVWAVRSFSASWEVKLGDGPPPIEAALTISRSDGMPVGNIVSHLPATLRDVTLFYRGHAYVFGTLDANGVATLGPGEERGVGRAFDGQRQGQNLQQWKDGDGAFTPAKVPRLGSSQGAFPLMREVMFRDLAEGPQPGNSGLRAFDQGWRVRTLPELPPRGRSAFREEVILVARVTPQVGAAEDVTQSAASPTRLWLGRLPGHGDRPRLEGHLTQETYLRVYIPVRPAAP
jgi:hypothetical protein